MRTYLDRYYDGDAAVAADAAAQAWFGEFDRTFLKGVPYCVPCGTTPCSLPTTVRADGGPQSVGEVQSVLTFELLISSATNRLMNDLAYLALDAGAAQATRDFRAALQSFQEEMEREGGPLAGLSPVARGQRLRLTAAGNLPPPENVQVTVKRFAIPIALVALASACGDSGTTVNSGSGGADRPTGANEVVIQIVAGGGFVPVQSALAFVPSATVLGDGTLITPAPVPAIYPGPALAPLQQVTLTAGEVDDLVARAEALGLLKGRLEFGQPPVADAPTTEVTIVAQGVTHRHDAYALGIDGFGLSSREVANRKALSAFVDAVTALRPGESAWTPAAVAVHVLGPYAADPQLPQPAVVWPLAAPPAADPAAGLRPCVVVEGADLATLTPLLDRANGLTPWVVDGVPMALAFQPVVPGQPGCR